MGGIAAGGMFGIASLTGAAVGGMLGASIGGMIDNAFLMPAIFGTPHQSTSGPRLESLKVNGFNEGEPMPYYIGPWNRGGCFLFYISNLKEVKQKTSSGGGGGKGGGGGGGSTSISYSYFVDIAVGIGDAWQDGAHSSYTRLWGDAKEILVNNEKIHIQSVKLRIVKRKKLLLLRSPPGGPDLRKLKPGVRATLAGWDNAENNGEFRLRATKKFAGSGTTQARFGNPANDTVTEKPGNFTTVDMELPEDENQRAESITFFDGKSDQEPWSIMQAKKGATSTPAYRGTAYIGVEQLAIADYGNRVPNFTVEPRVKAVETIAGALEKLFDRAELPNATYLDTRRVRGRMLGITAAGLQDTRSLVVPLMQAHNLRARVSNGKVIMFERGNEDRMAVPEADLGGNIGDTAPGEPFGVHRYSSRSLPDEVALSYIDRNRGYQRATVSARNALAVTTNKEEVSFPVTLTSVQAVRAAEYMVYSRTAEQNEVTFKLPPSYLDIEETDVLDVTFAGIVYPVRVTNVTRGANDVIECKGIIQGDDIVDLQDDCFGSDEGDPPETPTPYYPPPLQLYILDIPALKPLHVRTPGFYVAVAAEDPTVDFRGCGVMGSTNNTTFNQFMTIGTETTMGEVEVPLTGTEDLANTWDEVSEVYVTMLAGELESHTEDEVLAGFNVAMIGNEIVAFKNAVLQDTGVYLLTGLMRGLRDTFHEITTHVEDERFILLSDDSLTWVEKPFSAIGQERYFKAVPTSALETDFDSFYGFNNTVTTPDPSPPSPTLTSYKANTLRAFAPSGVYVNYDAGGNANIGWTYTSRELTSSVVAGGTGFVGNQNQEDYEIDVYDDAGLVFHRTIAVAGSPNTNADDTNGSVVTLTGNGTGGTAIYKAVDQAADILANGGSSAQGGPFLYRYFELTPNYGRGNYRDLTE